jgi:hypothetical protein
MQWKYSGMMKRIYSFFSHSLCNKLKYTIIIKDSCRRYWHDIVIVVLSTTMNWCEFSHKKKYCLFAIFFFAGCVFCATLIHLRSNQSIYFQLKNCANWFTLRIDTIPILKHPSYSIFSLFKLQKNISSTNKNKNFSRFSAILRD